MSETASVEPTVPLTNYAIYRTESGNGQNVGYVVNNILWDGISSYKPGSDLAMVADPDRLYPIGSTYPVTTASSGAAE